MKRLPLPTFSSFDFDVDERLIRWENHSSGTLASMQASTHDHEGLSLNLWNRKNAGMHFISASGSSRLVDRSPKHIQAQELGTTTVALIVKGEAFFHNSTHPFGQRWQQLETAGFRGSSC